MLNLNFAKMKRQASIIQFFSKRLKTKCSENASDSTDSAVPEVQTSNECTFELPADQTVRFLIFYYTGSKL